MAKALLNGILKLLNTLISIILLPIDALIQGIFPNLGTFFANISTFFTQYVYPATAWFSSLFPPTFKLLASIMISTVVLCYSIYYTYIMIMKIWVIIQKIKLW